MRKVCGGCILLNCGEVGLKGKGGGADLFPEPVIEKGGMAGGLLGGVRVFIGGKVDTGRRAGDPHASFGDESGSIMYENKVIV